MMQISKTISFFPPAFSGLVPQLIPGHLNYFKNTKFLLLHWQFESVNTDNHLTKEFLLLYIKLNVKKEFPMKKIMSFLLLLFTAEMHTFFFYLDGKDHRKEAAFVKSRIVSWIYQKWHTEVTANGLTVLKIKVRNTQM